MDSSADFSEDSFDVANWVNSALSLKPGSDDLEAFLASLAMKVHVLAQDYTDQLETGMSDAASTMPRVSGEIEHVEDILSSVSADMKELASSLNSFDQRNIAGVDALSRLDMLKSNMEDVVATLNEHAQWSILVREAKTLLESGGRLADSADRISTMQHSLELLSQMPGHEDRLETCEVMSSALLAAVHPRVKADVEASKIDIAAMHEYLHVFSKLGKKDELLSRYIQGRPSVLVSQWLDYSPMTSSFIIFFQHFLESFEEFLHAEQLNICMMFGDDNDSNQKLQTVSERINLKNDTQMKVFMDQKQSLKDSYIDSYSSNESNIAPNNLHHLEVLVCIFEECVKGTTAINSGGIAEKLRETMNPDYALAAYEMFDKFCRRVVVLLLKMHNKDNTILMNEDRNNVLNPQNSDGTAEMGNKEKNAESEHKISTDTKGLNTLYFPLLSRVMSAVYSPMILELEVMTYAEGVLLRTSIADALVGVRVGEVKGIGSPSARALDDSTGLVLLPLPESNNNSGSMKTELGTLKSYDSENRPAACSLYGERLVEASGKCLAPAQLCLKRIGDVHGIFGGVSVYSACSMAAQALTTHAISLTQKIEKELRISLDLSTESIYKSKNDCSLSDQGALTPAHHESSWKRAYDSTSSNGPMDSKLCVSLLPASLRALQTAGRTIKCVHILERLMLGNISQIGDFLGLRQTNDTALCQGFEEEMISQLLNAVEDQKSDLGAFYVKYLLALENSQNSAILEKSALAGLELRAFIHSIDEICMIQSLPAQNNTPPMPKLVVFCSTIDSLQSLYAAGGALFLDLCSSVPMRALNSLHDETLWTSRALDDDNYVIERNKQENEFGVCEEYLSIQDHMLPQQSITVCGEHILSLVQELEMFASSDALEDLVHLRLLFTTSSNLSSATSLLLHTQGWGDKFIVSLKSSLQNCKISGKSTNDKNLKQENNKSEKVLEMSEISLRDGIMSLSQRDSCAAAIKVAEQTNFGTVLTQDLSDFALECVIEDSESSGVEIANIPKLSSLSLSQSKAPELSNKSFETGKILNIINKDVASNSFVNEWLEAVCDSLCGFLLCQVLLIPVLTASGRAQLAVDIDYLKNVVSAVGLRLHPMVQHARTLIGRNPDELWDIVKKFTFEHTDENSLGILHRVIYCIANSCYKGKN